MRVQGEASAEQAGSRRYLPLTEMSVPADLPNVAVPAKKNVGEVVRLPPVPQRRGGRGGGGVKHELSGSVGSVSSWRTVIQQADLGVSARGRQV